MEKKENEEQGRCSEREKSEREGATFFSFLPDFRREQGRKT
jgi:hypothetical protein